MDELGDSLFLKIFFLSKFKYKQQINTNNKSKVLKLKRLRETMTFSCALHPLQALPTFLSY